MFKIIPITLFFFATTIFAQGNACKEEVKKFCPEIVKPLEQMNCLLKNEKDLSDPCKQQLQRLSKAAEGTGTRGRGGISSFGGPMGGMGLMAPDKTILNFSGTYWGEGHPTVMEQSRFNLSTPIHSKDGKSFALSAGASVLHFNERQPYREGGMTPKELKRVDLGVQYNQRMANKGLLGIRTSVGTASDQPFYSMDETTFSLISFYTRPQNSKGQWFWTFYLSNNNPVANYVPIPGFMYLYRNQSFTGMFGLPFFSVQWTPVDPWVFSVSMFLINLNTEIAYGHRDQFQYFFGFSSAHQSFLRAGREDREDRLFFKEKKIFLGMRTPLTKTVSFEIQGGSSFDRKLEEGKRFNETHFEADIGRSWFSTATLNIQI